MLSKCPLYKRIHLLYIQLCLTIYLFMKKKKRNKKKTNNKIKSINKTNPLKVEKGRQVHKCTPVGSANRVNVHEFLLRGQTFLAWPRPVFDTFDPCVLVETLRWTFRSRNRIIYEGEKHNDTLYTRHGLEYGSSVVVQPLTYIYLSHTQHTRKLNAPYSILCFVQRDFNSTPFTFY